MLFLKKGACCLFLDALAKRPLRSFGWPAQILRHIGGDRYTSYQVFRYRHHSCVVETTFNDSAIQRKFVRTKPCARTYICHSFSEDTIAAKFDSGPIRRFRCAEPTDGTSGLLFINGSKRFLAELKKAKTLVVEAQFYQHALNQTIFDVRGLDWK